MSQPNPRNQNQAQNNQNLPAQRNQNQGIALAGGRSFMPSPAEWSQIKEMGNAAFKSGLLPQGIKSGDAAAIIGLKAWELGIPLMEGFAHIHIINGKPGISREMMQTLIVQNMRGGQIDILESTDKICRVEFKAHGRKPHIEAFTIDDAKRAQLLSKPIWQQYPKAMLANRAISAGARLFAPEALRGCGHTPEELESIPTTGRRVADLEPEAKPPAEETIAAIEPQSVAAATKKPFMTKIELRRLGELLRGGKWNQADASAYMAKAFKVTRTTDLTEDNYNSLSYILEHSDFQAAMSELEAMNASKESHPEIVAPTDAVIAPAVDAPAPAPVDPGLAKITEDQAADLTLCLSKSLWSAEEATNFARINYQAENIADLNRHQYAEFRKLLTSMTYDQALLEAKF